MTCRCRLQGRGHLVALNQVDVRPQITGIIRTVHFREGDDIRPGQVLFDIDPAEAKAQLSRTQAQAAQIKRNSTMPTATIIAPPSW